MTTNEYILKLQRQIDAIVKDDIPLQKGVRNVMALQSKRIFLDALNADGGIIGSYGNKPLYVSEKWRLTTNLPAFPLVGKGVNKDTKKLVSNIQTRVTKKVNVKANGDERKSGYFPNYLAFKKAVKKNKRVGTVDLFLTGELHRHWANNDSFAKADAIKINQHNYIVAISDKDVKKVAKYNRVFNLSLSERKIFLSTVQNELFKALK